MKALKKLTLSITGVAVLGTVVLGSYNSMFVNNVSFMSADSGIKFTKRLDEINGRITIGRMAASAAPWGGLNKKVKKIVVSKKTDMTKKKTFKVQRPVQKEAKKVAQNNSQISPAINADLDLKLENVFYKKPYDKGTFSGSAKTVDGIIEEIYISMPSGQSIEINTRDRMVGNVFQYEDTETREMKSGMFYEVKKGTYMITLTNDSQFPGARFEFKTTSSSEVGYNDDYYSAQESWDMDQQNMNNDVAQDQRVNQPSNNVNYQENDYAKNNQGGSEAYGFNFKS
jgi:hypothetical protein